MSFVTTADGTRIFYKDWGAGRPVVLSHGWPLNADSWEAQQLFLADNGYRVIAHDRRGHGRSTQTWHGNEMDTYADDLAALITELGPAGRHAGRVLHRRRGDHPLHRTARDRSGRAGGAGLGRAAADGPARRQPGGVPIEVFDGLRAGSLADRSQLYRDLADGPFFGGLASQGIRDAFWLQSMAAGHRNAYESIAAFSATDFREDLARFDVPTLVVHGDADQVVPFEVGGAASAALVKKARLIVYPGAPHGITDTHKEQLGNDLLAFLKEHTA